jgi:hypothetical protein
MEDYGPCIQSANRNCHSLTNKSQYRDYVTTSHILGHRTVRLNDRQIYLTP